MLGSLTKIRLRVSPFVCLLTNGRLFCPTAALSLDHWGSGGGFLCLPESTTSAQSTRGDVRLDTSKESSHVKDTLRNVAPHHLSDCGRAPPPPPSKTTSLETHTNTPSYVHKDRLRYARAQLPLRTHLLKSRTDPQRHSVRLCHSGRRPDEPAEPQLTHTDGEGRAAMVDVGGKAATRRQAVASATVLLGPAAFRLLRDNQLRKGDALAVAQLAGIMASKRTSGLIPLCHPLPLDHAAVALELQPQRSAVVVTATCSTTGSTGVEMEALTAASVAALTLYDMCKAVSHDILITDIKLLSKTGGKKDFHRPE